MECDAHDLAVTPRAFKVSSSKVDPIEPCAVRPLKPVSLPLSLTRAKTPSRSSLALKVNTSETHCPPSPCSPSPTLLTASRSHTSLNECVKRGMGMGISSAALYDAGVSVDALGVWVSGMVSAGVEL